MNIIAIKPTVRISPGREANVAVSDGSIRFAPGDPIPSPNRLLKRSEAKPPKRSKALHGLNQGG